MIRLPALCRFWAIVFVIAGLGFAAAPALVADFLNGQAGMLGLVPGIPTERNTLWYALALSLMATITYLAWEAGRPGASPVLVRALVLSKLVSTAGFSVAAITLASGWWLCALADGFIAVTLLIARRPERTVSSP